MWEGWTECTNTDDVKSYELMIGSKIKVLLAVTLAMVEHKLLVWQAEVVAFAPSAGEYIDYEGKFSSFEEAEAKAWKDAQISVEVRSNRL